MEIYGSLRTALMTLDKRKSEVSSLISMVISLMVSFNADIAEMVAGVGQLLKVVQRLSGMGKVIGTMSGS